MRESQVGWGPRTNDLPTTTMNHSIKTPASFVCLAAIVLFVLHQDFWYWGDATLVFGFLPIGLAYHAIHSILAGLLWAMAVKFMWPGHVEDWAAREDGLASRGPAP